MKTVILLIVLAPLAGALIAGLFGKRIGRQGAHRAAIAGVSVAFVLSLWLFNRIVLQHGPGVEWSAYAWAVVGGVRLEIGFLIDVLTVTMMVVVTFVSLMVHIYTIGYMHDDPGISRCLRFPC